MVRAASGGIIGCGGETAALRRRDRQAMQCMRQTLKSLCSQAAAGNCIREARFVTARYCRTSVLQRETTGGIQKKDESYSSGINRANDAILKKKNALLGIALSIEYVHCSVSISHNAKCYPIKQHIKNAGEKHGCIDLSLYVCVRRISTKCFVVICDTWYILRI